MDKRIILLSSSYPLGHSRKIQIWISHYFDRKSVLRKIPEKTKKTRRKTKK